MFAKIYIFFCFLICSNSNSNNSNNNSNNTNNSNNDNNLKKKLLGIQKTIREQKKKVKSQQEFNKFDYNEF